MIDRRETRAGTIILPLLAGCAATIEPPEISPAPLDGQSALQNFTQRIEGTAIDLEMIAVAGTPQEWADEGAVNAFYISKTEIPWELYDLFVYPELDSRLRGNDEENAVDDDGHPREGGDPVDAIARPSKPYVPPDRGFGHAGYPAISMTHHAATEFCKWLSARTGRTFRLPTRTEWQHAFMRSLPPNIADLTDPWETAWLEENSDWKTHPVGTRNTELRRIHDMFGNAAEWIADDQDGDGLHEVVGAHYLISARNLSLQWIEEQTSAWNASDPQIPKSKWWLPDAPFVGFRVVCEPKSETTDERR